MLVTFPPSHDGGFEWKIEELIDVDRYVWQRQTIVYGIERYVDRRERKRGTRSLQAWQQTGVESLLRLFDFHQPLPRACRTRPKRVQYARLEVDGRYTQIQRTTRLCWREARLAREKCGRCKAVFTQGELWPMFPLYELYNRILLFRTSDGSEEGEDILK